MIIWGSTGKEKRLSQETFYCPKCREDTEGDHIRMSRYFTLYFIPLFPMQTLGEFVRCCQCEGEFKTSVLDLTAEDVEKSLKPWKCENCGNNNPSEYLECLNCRQDR